MKEKRVYLQLFILREMRILRVTFTTFKGVRELNEDSIIINDKISIYGVADGVSSLTPFISKEGYTGGYIASNEVKQYFESQTTYNSFTNDLFTINNKLYRKMKEYNIDILKKEQLWGTALAVVKVSDTYVDFIQMGDCMVLALYQNNEVRPLTRIQTSNVENAAIAKWKDMIDKGIRNREDLFENVKDILISNRQKSNTLDGYGVLNGENQALDYVESGKINRIGLKHLILLTDGMFLPAESIPNSINYWNYVVECILSKGIEKYTRDLIDLEETDPECVRFPRFKKSDDKTGMMISF
ncbi:hypothetical protein G4D62_07240 [Bacillus shackletonii]|nr:hypothetical protein [Heyndrickxia shackletonii]